MCYLYQLQRQLYQLQRQQKQLKIGRTVLRVWSASRKFWLIYIHEEGVLRISREYECPKMAVRVCLSRFCLQQFTQCLLLVPHSAVAISILLLGCSVFSLTHETQHWYLWWSNCSLCSAAPALWDMMIIAKCKMIFIAHSASSALPFIIFFCVLYTCIFIFTFSLSLSLSHSLSCSGTYTSTCATQDALDSLVPSSSFMRDWGRGYLALDCLKAMN